jgi:hypothetical protein
MFCKVILEAFFFHVTERRILFPWTGDERDDDNWKTSSCRELRPKFDGGPCWEWWYDNVSKGISFISSLLFYTDWLELRETVRFVDGDCQFSQGEAEGILFVTNKFQTNKSEQFLNNFIIRRWIKNIREFKLRVIRQTANARQRQILRYQAIKSKWTCCFKTEIYNYSFDARKKIRNENVQRKFCQESSNLPFAFPGNVKLKLPNRESSNLIGSLSNYLDFHVIRSRPMRCKNTWTLTLAI